MFFRPPPAGGGGDDGVVVASSSSSFQAAIPAHHPHTQFHEGSMKERQDDSLLHASGVLGIEGKESPSFSNPAAFDGDRNSFSRFLF